jgi:hypothetical protein
MAKSCKLPPFDGNLIDGGQYADSEGVIYEYNKKSDSFINKGVIKTPPNVNEETNGLIYPKLYDRILLINKYKNQLNLIKFQTEIMMPSYFYYFNSSDDLIRFYGETRETLRCEVDRGRLYQKILRNVCVGERGDVGYEGDQGWPGMSAPKERRIIPKFISNVEATFTVDVNIPIDTPISIRLYNKYDIKTSEILIETDGTNADNITIKNYTKSTIISENPTIKIAKTEDVWTIEATIKLSLGSYDKHYFKTRQIGPKGETGPNGLNFLQTKLKWIDDLGIVSTNAVINVRKSSTSSDILYKRQAVTEGSCVYGLTPVYGLPLDIVERALWVAILETSRECKDIVTIKPLSLSAISEPVLNLPFWTPMKQCADRLRFPIATYDWQDDIQAEEKGGVIPFNILKDPRPPEQCCQQDLFWCANVGDSCPVEGDVPKIIRFETDECPCDCQPRTDLMIFDGETTSNTYQCSINGKMHEYRQEIILNKSKTKITIALNNNNYCDEHTKFKIEPCSIRSNIIPTCLEDEMTQDPEGILAITDMGNASIIIIGTGTMRLDIQVNLDKTVCCIGYDLTVTAEVVE